MSRGRVTYEFCDLRRMTVSAVVEFDRWSQTHSERASTGTLHLWPSETLVRLFRGRFVPGLDRECAGKTVLDVGCP